MNATYELYKAGGNLFSESNKEMEEDLTKGQRARKVDPTDAYLNFVSSLLTFKNGGEVTLKEVLVSSVDCKDQFTATDTKLISNLHVMFTTQVNKQQLGKITLHFAKKIARVA